MRIPLFWMTKLSIELPSLTFDLHTTLNCTGPAGAGDAAAWAISRSLNALNTAEESSSQGRTIDDIVDEQDSDASQYESSSYGDSNARSEEYQRGI